MPGAPSFFSAGRADGDDHVVVVPVGLHAAAGGHANALELAYGVPQGVDHQPAVPDEPRHGGGLVGLAAAALALDLRLQLANAQLAQPGVDAGLAQRRREQLAQVRQGRLLIVQPRLGDRHERRGQLIQPQLAVDVADILDLLDYFEIRAKKTCRKSKHAVYLKRSDDVSDVLTLMGASHAVLTLQGVRVKKDVSNRVNRQLNCDNSNINRVTETALRQVEDIRYIETELGLDKLPAPLREMAEARLNNQEASLANLGELLTPPLGKSGVNARLRKLSEIADRLRSGEEIKL